MNSYYNQEHTKEEIATILYKIKRCIQTGHYYIAANENRHENVDFIHTYNIQTKKQKAILLSIKVEDFCHSLQNTKHGFEHEILYVFAPIVSLFNLDNIKEQIRVYIKFNLIESAAENNVVVISFHKAHKPVQYAFK